MGFLFTIAAVLIALVRYHMKQKDAKDRTKGEHTEVR